jgi:hypothetical protein
MDQLLVNKAIALHATALPLHNRVETMECVTAQHPASKATSLHVTALPQVIAATAQRMGNVPIIMGITAGILVDVRMGQEPATPIVVAMAVARPQRIAEEHPARSSGREMCRHHSERLIAQIAHQGKALHNVPVISDPVVRATRGTGRAQGLQITLLP